MKKTILLNTFLLLITISVSAQTVNQKKEIVVVKQNNDDDKKNVQISINLNGEDVSDIAETEAFLLFNSIGESLEINTDSGSKKNTSYEKVIVTDNNSTKTVSIENYENGKKEKRILKGKEAEEYIEKNNLNNEQAYSYSFSKTGDKGGKEKKKVIVKKEQKKALQQTQKKK
jgi:hypothetical protein